MSRKRNQKNQTSNPLMNELESLDQELRPTSKNRKKATTPINSSSSNLEEAIQELPISFNHNIVTTRNYPRQRRLKKVLNDYVNSSHKGDYSVRSALIYVLTEIEESDFEVFKDVKGFKEQICQDLGVNIRTAYRYLTQALDALYNETIDDLKDILAVHIVRYEELYHAALAQNNLSLAVHILKEMQELYGLHRPHIQTQILNVQASKQEIENQYENYSVEDLNTIIEIEEKYARQEDEKRNLLSTTGNSKTESTDSAETQEYPN